MLALSFGCRLSSSEEMWKTVSEFCRDYEHYYFIRTHDVQIPLPVFLRKKAAVPSRKPISLPERGMVEPISITPPAGTPSDKCQSSAADENALVSLRLPPTRRKQPGKLKTVPLFIIWLFINIVVVSVSNGK